MSESLPRLDEIPLVLFIEDLARLLGTSTSTIRRGLRAHTFPIPTLPSVDRKPRWSREAVLRFLRNDRPQPTRTRRAHRSAPPRQERPQAVQPAAPPRAFTPDQSRDLAFGRGR